MLRTLDQGIDVCVTVPLVDGFVLARFGVSSFDELPIGRGAGQSAAGDRSRSEAERAAVVHQSHRAGTLGRELKATSVLALTLDEVSAKVGSGPPIDDEEDYKFPVWAGVAPIRVRVDTPVRDARVLPDVPLIDTQRFTKKGR